MKRFYFILLLSITGMVFSNDRPPFPNEKKSENQWFPPFFRPDPKESHKKQHRRMRNKIFDFVTVLQIEDDIIEATGQARILKENFVRREELLREERKLIMKELEYFLNEQKQGRDMNHSILQAYKKLYNNTSNMQALVLEHVNTLQKQSEEIYNKYIEKTSKKITEFEQNPQQLTEKLLKLYNEVSN